MYISVAVNSFVSAKSLFWEVQYKKYRAGGPFNMNNTNRLQSKTDGWVKWTGPVTSQDDFSLLTSGRPS